MQLVTLYGFGSFFKGAKSYSDIDLAVIHDDLSEESCLYAIKCKHALLENLPLAHVLLLSKAEEAELGFLSKSSAIFIGKLEDSSFEFDLASVIALFDVGDTA